MLRHALHIASVTTTLHRSCCVTYLLLVHLMSDAALPHLLIRTVPSQALYEFLVLLLAQRNVSDIRCQLSRMGS